MDYIFTVRRIRNGQFQPEPGNNSFLIVPPDADDILPEHRVGGPTKKMPDTWARRVLHESKLDHVPEGQPNRGDIVVHVHGFNVSTKKMLRRHRLLAKGLRDQGFEGVVVSYDWPSADKALNYLEDRTDAKITAIRLVDSGITGFVQRQTPDCPINMHIVAHSMGAYVVREAFDDADDRRMVAANAWNVSQVLLMSADVSAASMCELAGKSSSLYRHCTRLTNYNNPHDSALSLSNMKRVGVAPRVGRVGLPETAPTKAVNVDCGAYFEANRGVFTEIEYGQHTWYYHDQTFMRDAYETILGVSDRARLPTRALALPAGLTNRLALIV
ncbi:alpha/beta fold hydrolase [Donghicola sp. C2-DW-16]|uniref:Alpha/beta fold hydrolase n=1 Tax=Donghicola mangrovi TaxID=2729614 RepID=A0ABX2PBX1_9RHOB|nr:alpha/beta hydrolase [Donghicola mangrovi]NVO26512.1 alpha/beta fold hydrolase [Donghicola mangrovi]